MSEADDKRDPNVPEEPITPTGDAPRAREPDPNIPHLSPSETPLTPRAGEGPAAGITAASGDVGPLPPASEEARKAARRNAWVSIAAFFGTLFAADQGFRRSQMARRLAAENQYIAKPAHFSSTPEGADVAITGDSRMLHGFNPHVVENAVLAERGERIRAYNGGLSGAPPMAQMAWIRRYLTHPHRPRVVIMSISPYMFSSRIVRATARESLTTMYRLSDLGAMLRAGAGAEDLATVLNVGLFEAVRFRPRVLEMIFRFNGFGEPSALGDQGFYQNGEVDPYSQDARARGRGMGYRTEMWRPEAHFGNEHMGYFEEALRMLQANGVRTIVMNSPSATQVDLAYGPRSIYDQHIAYVQRMAARYGATYVDARHPPPINDEDYNDGDHLGGNGAGRFTAWLTHEHIIPQMGGARSERPATCRAVFDFEDSALPGWTRAGNAMQDPIAAQARRMQQPVYGYAGHRFLTTYVRAVGDGATGELTSPPFRLAGSQVRLRVGGGSSAQTQVSLVVDGREVHAAQGRNDEILRDVVWNIGPEIRDRDATLRVRDNATGGWGHLQVDDVAVCP